MNRRALASLAGAAVLAGVIATAAPATRPPVKATTRPPVKATVKATVKVEVKVEVGVGSQQLSPARAQVSASVAASGKRPARPGTPGGAKKAPPSPHPTPAPPKQPGSAAPGPAYPSLSASSSLLANPTPFGPSSFWYPIPGGLRCVYLPHTSPLCFTVTPAGQRTLPPQPPADPGAIAVSAAGRLVLGAGRIEASPSARAAGLTGVDSWFWLAPRPEAQLLSVSQAGERVAVRAQPAAVEWRFGDGASLRAGAGVPYRPGEPPPGAVRHRYQTRCLPGDQGRSLALSSCGRQGYTLEALIVWQISYRASGPLARLGALPSRTATASLAYPVSEARAFLSGPSAP